MQKVSLAFLELHYNENGREIGVILLTEYYASSIRLWRVILLTQWYSAYAEWYLLRKF